MTGVANYARFLRDAPALLGWGGLVAPFKLAAAKALFGIGPEKVGEILDAPFSQWGRFHEDRSFLHTICNHGEGRRFWKDKVAGYARLREVGLPFATVHAVVDRSERDHPFRTVDSREDLAALLASTDLPAETFWKPSGGGGGLGSFALSGDGRSIAKDGAPVSVEDLWTSLRASTDELGYVVQPVYRTHPGLSPLGGDHGLLTFRFQTVLTPDGPEIVFVLLKLMTRPGLADNYRRGVSGNLVAAVGPDTGEIERVTGAWPGRVVATDRLRHPTSGAALPGFRIDDYAKIRDLALAVQQAFPESPMQANDLALTEDGPVVIETNNTGALGMPHLALLRSTVQIFEPVIERAAIDPERRAKAHAQLWDRVRPNRLTGRR